MQNPEQMHKHPLIEKRRQRVHIPAEAVERIDKTTGAVVYTYERNGSYPYVAIMYRRGKAIKAAANYAYRTAEQRGRYIGDFFAGELASLAAKEKRAAERKNADRGLKKGDILVSSWGYEQTNVDFYEVTGLYGKFGVVLRPIASRHVESCGFMSEYVAPCPGDYTGEPVRKMARNGVVKINTYMQASKTDGREKYYQSHYA